MTESAEVLDLGVLGKLAGQVAWRSAARGYRGGCESISRASESTA